MFFFILATNLPQMSIQHLTYCSQEIINASKFLEITNSGFYKRAVARLIAIRTDDFIKIGFKVNRAELNNQRIRDDLNALQDLYVNYFKLQRDKYGAHFQDLDLAVRLETWSNIDLTRADFFTSVPVAIYQLFNTVAGYSNLSTTDLSIVTDDIAELNERYNFEKYPNIASDILSLTRPNSGGIIHFSGLQTKAGVLKSIELLIDYELELFKTYKHDPNLREVFAKLFIADLISYADNFITRSDIPTTAVQYEYALDHFIDPVMMKAHLKIMDAFKANYKFEIIRDELRLIRNKVAGHIDISLPVSDIQNLLQNFNLERFEAFYNQIKNTFQKMCYTDMLLRTFAFSPYEKLHGVSKMVGFGIKTFDGSPEEVPAVIFLDPNDEKEYENQLSLWINDNNGDSRSYFWDCCANSDIAYQQSGELLLVDGETCWVNCDVRKVHVYFENRLSDPLIATSDKIQIINLFIALRSGYPDTLAHILIRTFQNDVRLRRSYAKGIGQLLSKPAKFVFDKLNELLSSNDFGDQYEGLLAMYRIDLRYRFHNQGQHLKGETTFSKTLKVALQAERHKWVGLIYNLALAGEFVYGVNHTGNDFKVTYYLVFEKNIISLLKGAISPLLKNEKDKRSLRKMERAFHNKRFATFLALIGDFLDMHQHKATAERFYTVLRGGYIEFVKNDPDELHNYAVASLRCGDLTEAISIARFLVKDHSYSYQYYYFLLSLYLEDRQYENEFLIAKSYVLNNFNLTNKEQIAIIELNYKV
jgi:hypothetical protein